MKNFNNTKKAFTLIELLIVIAIIGILFIVLVSRVDFATDKAKATGVQTDFRSFQVAFEQVAKENAGFNSFGWDEGDDNGDRVRNSYDKGDTDQDGEIDTGETWIGRKEYTETWTGVYTLVKPGTTTYDSDALAALERAINANLDPKLHITIANNGVITMANQARDPWKNEYHGRYLSNAAADNMDRGLIIIYSNGANGVNGSADGIAGGLVNITTPGENVNGKDDYAIATFYTSANGYGEVVSITKGFSNNQVFKDASAVPVTPVSQVPVIPAPGGSGNPQPDGGAGNALPTPNLNGAVANAVSPIAYEWSELKALAQAKLGSDELRDTYGIEVGDYKEVNGTKYLLVDLDGNAYGGFVFMYNSQTKALINENNTSVSSYANSDLAEQMETLYENSLDEQLQQAIKQVTIISNDFDASTTQSSQAKLFLASAAEVGFSNSRLSSINNANAEGACFDYFARGILSTGQKFTNAIGMSFASTWWVRSAYGNGGSLFAMVYGDGETSSQFANNTNQFVVPAFVIG